MYTATAPEGDVEEDPPSDKWMELIPAEGQPSASSTAIKTASSAASTSSSEFSAVFYDVVLFDYIHEMMVGDSKKISKVAPVMLRSIYNEDNALSLN